MMETLAVAICGMNATLIGALIWLLKFSATKMLGNGRNMGVLPRISKSLQNIENTLSNHTRAIQELKEEVSRQSASR